MLFTILTPTLDSAAVVEGAIASVASQSLGEREHLVIDGGSRDATCDILRCHPDLRWTSEPDAGIYDALNKGVAAARGEWLMVLGADDRLAAPDVLERIVNAARPEDDLLYGDVRLRSNGARFDGPFDAGKLYHHNICQQAIAYRRRLFDRVGGFSLDYPLLADWEHNLRWFFDPGVRHRYLDLVTVDYDDGGASAQRFDAAFYRRRRALFLDHAWRQAPLGLLAAKAAREAVQGVLHLDGGAVARAAATGGRLLGRLTGLGRGG